MTKIGIIIGSVRQASNTLGFVNGHLTKLLQSNFSKVDNDQDKVEFDVIHLLSSPGHPLPAIIDDVMPAAATPPHSYGENKTQQWSQTVSSWQGVLVVTPQYNWGIPAMLKQSFDVIFKEWVGKPVGAITLGGRGGGKCGEQLQSVMGGGMKMRFIEKRVAITLPKEYIGTDQRIQGDEDWLNQHDEEILELVSTLVEMIKNPPEEEEKKA